MSIPTLSTFCIYIVAMLGIGAYAWRVTDSLDDYLLGGRLLSPGVTAPSYFLPHLGSRTFRRCFSALSCKAS